LYLEKRFSEKYLQEFIEVLKEISEKHITTWISPSLTILKTRKDMLKLVNDK
jgi:hypothetical protein